MIKAGLTGGIGSGKSLACRIFASLGVPIIDADEIAHRLTAPGNPQLEAIRDVFGDGVSDTAGALKRDELRRIVFSDDAKRKQLEDILHPGVKEEIQAATAALHAPYCIVSVPLLIESGMLDLVDTTIVLDCPKSAQVERAGKRSGLSPAEILAIIEKQASRRERLAAADIVIDNSGDEDALKKQLISLHETLTNKAAEQK